ncbi:MAG: hypothetical protein K6D95_05795 [Treponema sp.]|nr:hypothetical protein [Treponema sp.]
MTSGQKIAFSLLTTIILVAGFALTARTTNLFKILDDRYYFQVQVNEKNAELNRLSKSVDLYIQKVLEKIENSYIKEGCIRSYMDQNPSEALQQERRNLTAQLFSDIPSLSGIRLIDKNGKSLHYSSYDYDVLKVNGSYKTYKNYPEVVKDASELEYNLINVDEGNHERKVLVDAEKNRLIISMPFYWIGDIYSASMLFYFNFSKIEQELINTKELSLNQSLTLCSYNLKGGFVLNLPNINQEEFFEPVSQKWQEKRSVTSPEKILQSKNNKDWLMLSSSDGKYLLAAGVYPSETFTLPKEFIYLLYVCVTITLFLISFLLFSLKRSSEAVLKKRIKKIQFGVIKEFLDNKEKVEWNAVLNQLKSRKDDLSSDIYSSLGVHSKKEKKHLEEFLEKSWKEIFEVLEGSAPKNTVTSEQAQGGQTGQSGQSDASAPQFAGITMEQLRSMLEEVLQETSLNINLSNANIKSQPAVKAASLTEVEDVEEVEELDDVEEVEEVDDVEEVEELTDDVEELDDVEEVEEVEELADDVEELDEVEDVEEVEELDDVEEVEELDDVEEVEELADDVEELEITYNPVKLSEYEPEAEEVSEEELETLEAVDDVQVSAFDSPFVVPEVKPISEYDNDSKDSYIKSDKFATCDNLFSDEICLGAEYTVAQTEYIPVDFTVYTLPGVNSNKDDDKIEEVKEEPVKILKGKGLLAALSSIRESEEKLANSQPIVEADGVFSISENLRYNESNLDKSFQTLVHSVLKQ